MTIATESRTSETLQTYKWTIEQYHLAIEAGLFEDQHLELLNGELVLMPSEGSTHAGRGGGVAAYLRSLVENRAMIRESSPITIPVNGSEPEPDLAIVEFRLWEYEEHHPYPENIYWTIEFSQTSLKKDLETKDKIYAQAGIREYWVVDLKASRLVVFRDPMDGEYQSRQVYTSGLIKPLAFPEIEVAIEVLLGKNRWTP